MKVWFNLAKIELCILVCLGWLILSPHLAMATNFGYCSPFLTQKDTILLGIEGDVPNIKNVDWEKVLSFIKKNNLKFAEENGIKVEITNQSPEDALAGHSGYLYIKLMYSFAKKSNFSIPLDSDQLAVWTTIYMNPEDGGIHDLMSVKGTPPTFIGYAQDEKSFIPLTAAAYRHVERLACSVLAQSKQLFCTDVKDFSKNKIVSKPELCKPRPKEASTDNLIDFIEKNWQETTHDKPIIP